MCQAIYRCGSAAVQQNRCLIPPATELHASVGGGIVLVTNVCGMIGYGHCPLEEFMANPKKTPTVPGH